MAIISLSERLNERWTAIRITPIPYTFMLKIFSPSQALGKIGRPESEIPE